MIGSVGGETTIHKQSGTKTLHPLAAAVLNFNLKSPQSGRSLVNSKRHAVGRQPILGQLKLLQQAISALPPHLEKRVVAIGSDGTYSTTRSTSDWFVNWRPTLGW